MRGHADHRRTRTGRPAGAPSTPLLLPLSVGWHEVTLRDFVRQVEHEFGRNVDLSSLRHVGLGRDEALDPSDIRQLCELLGLPPEDFGVS